MTEQRDVSFDRMDRMDADERLYEEEIEKPWEKGGSGLVFYTDAVYWDAARGEFEDLTADGWDVDTRASREARKRLRGGDKSEAITSGGIDMSDYPDAAGVVYDSIVDPVDAETPYEGPSAMKRRRTTGDYGVGSRMLTQMGWTSDIGRTRPRRQEIIEVVEKHDKTGIGFIADAAPRTTIVGSAPGEVVEATTHEQEMSRLTTAAVQKRPEHIIGCIFDDR